MSTSSGSQWLSAARTWGWSAEATVARARSRPRCEKPAKSTEIASLNRRPTCAIGFSITESSPPFQQEWMPWPSTSCRICARFFSVSRSPGRCEFHGGQASCNKVAGSSGLQIRTSGGWPHRMWPALTSMLPLIRCLALPRGCPAWRRARISWPRPLDWGAWTVSKPSDFTRSKRLRMGSPGPRNSFSVL